MVSMIPLHFFVSKLLDDVLSGEWRGGEEEELEKNVCKMRWISLCCCPSSRCRHCNSQSVVVLLYTSSRGLGDHIYKLHYHMQPLCSSLCWKDSSSSILQDYQKLSLKCWSFFFSLLPSVPFPLHFPFGSKSFHLIAGFDLSRESICILRYIHNILNLQLQPTFSLFFLDIQLLSIHQC